MTKHLGGQRHLPPDIDLDDIETAHQAAGRLGVEQVTIWQWVRRGHLQPLNVGIKPMFFLVADVDACAAARKNNVQRARLSDAQRMFRERVTDL